MTAIQIPPPSAEAVTASEPGFFGREVKMKGGSLVVLSLGIFILGFGAHAWFGGGGPPPRPVVAAKPAPNPAAPTGPVVVPVASGPTTAPAEVKPVNPPVEPAKTAPTIADLPAGGPSEKPAGTESEPGLWKPATKKKPVQKAALVDPLADDAAKSTPKPAVATTPKPKPAESTVAAATKPAPAVASTPKPAAAKPSKKPTKVWVDPFAN